MRVLYANQTAQVSGAERSLLDLIAHLPPDVEPHVAAPRGALSEELGRRGIAWTELPAVDLSFRLHPLHTTRGLAHLAAAARGLRRAARRVAPDILHANTTRATLTALPARRQGGPPLIGHVRDWIPAGRLPMATLRAVEMGATAVIANSGFVAEQLPRRRGGAPVRVIHDAVDTSAFADASWRRERAREALALAEGETALAVVAQLTPWKGQDDAIRILATLLADHPGVRLLLAGSAKFDAPGASFDNPAFERDLQALAAELGVADEVGFLGERQDVPDVMAAADILLVPSWREAFGRVVIEGMAAGRPVLATATGGPAELVRDGVDGLVLPPRRPQLWAEAIAGLLRTPDRMREMGERGRERAAGELGAGRLAAEVAGLYREVLAG
jgi:glycosyltransferase involved in cell wall biosynthesis